MNDTWTTHHTGIYDNREVEVKTYSEGGYRVKTKQKKDDYGNVSSDRTGVIVISPTSAGRSIAIDGETINEVREQLLEEGFSEEDANEIVGYFP